MPSDKLSIENADSSKEVVKPSNVLDAEFVEPKPSPEAIIATTLEKLNAFRELVNTGFYDSVSIGINLKNNLIIQLNELEKILKGK